MGPDNPFARHRVLAVLVVLLAAVIGYVFASDTASAETIQGSVGAMPVVAAHLP